MIEVRNSEYNIEANTLTGTIDSEHRANCPIVKYKDDTPNFKGYIWEMNCKEWILKIPHILYEGNPADYYEWKNEHNKNAYDGIVTLPNGAKIFLEMKFRNVDKIYHSWFIKDWLPREANIIVTNKPSVVEYSDKRTLDKRGVKLMSPSEAKVYIGRLVRNILHPSKYLYLNSLIHSLINIIKNLVARISSKLTSLGVKTRIKNCIPMSIHIEKVGLPVSSIEEKLSTYLINLSSLPYTLGEYLHFQIAKRNKTRIYKSNNADKLKSHTSYVKKIIDILEALFLF